MAYKKKSETIRYNNEYNKRAYDRINLTVPKGQKEVIQASAAGRGESLNEYIKKAISERMERDQAQPTKENAQQEPTPEEQPTKPLSFLESVRVGVEQIVAETDRNTEEEDLEKKKKHNHW